MEDLMLGNKRSVPLWRQKRPRRLPVEQSLTAGRTNSRVAKPAIAAKAKAIEVARTRSRMMAEAKRMGRFSEA